MAEQQVQTKVYKPVDIIDFSMQSKPTKVTDAFGQLISDKVVNFLANKKQEVSAKMFKTKEDIPEPTETEVTAEPESEVQTTEA